jgi:hypothetical protein
LCARLCEDRSHVRSHERLSRAQAPAAAAKRLLLH